MKNHILKAHNDIKGDQKCLLLKIEGAYAKGFWLFIDVPLNQPLSVVDTFLRRIWLECCGHLSGFYINSHEIAGSRKLGTLPIGAKLLHEYDFGSTTKTLITVLAEVSRKSQKDNVRLLARNIPPVFKCSVCDKPADYICCECIYETDEPFFCEECAEPHEEEHDMMLPVTNSPRLGVCGYDGAQDIYTFYPGAIKQR
ncbi:MAG: hypothetical protein FWF04_06105 [Clostridiales bacterium]|nr:hypothetical protein [Clostridiales bacterium]